MPKREEVLQQMIATLVSSDREWDIQPGSPEYKILESVAQQVEQISYNSTLLDYHFDVDSKVGIELDMFMALFGFARIRGKRATGQVTFGMKNAATQDYEIPRGTQVMVPSTTSSSAIYFTTMTDAILVQNSREIEVPVQAVLAGTAGNVSAGTINAITTNIGAISYCYNANDTAGGRNAESDADLRDRWRRTVFRNMSGTEDQFLGVVYNDSAFVKRANLVGPVERYTEQIQLLPPMDLTTYNPWVGTLGANVANGATTFTIASSTTSSPENFANPTSEAPIWVGFFENATIDVPVTIAKVTNFDGDQTFTMDGQFTGLAAGITNEIQTIDVTGMDDEVGELFILEYSGTPTTSITRSDLYDIGTGQDTSVAAITAALENIPALLNNVYVTGWFDNGSNAGSWVVEFVGGLAATDTADILVNTETLCDVTTATSITGGAGFSDLMPIGSTVRQLFLSYNNDIQYVFPQGGEVVTYNTSGTNLVDVGVPTSQIEAVGNDYYFGTYHSTDSLAANYIHLIYNPVTIEENSIPSVTGPFLFVSQTGGEKFGKDSIIQMEYEYTPLSSRNVPTTTGGIVNRIDIFSDGVDSQSVREQVSFPPHTTAYQFGPTGSVDETRFLRDDGTTTPKDSNYFIPLAKNPVVIPPSSITAMSSDPSPKPVTYYLGEDYWFVDDTSKLEGSTRAISGLEWTNTGAVAISNDTAFAVQEVNNSKGPLKKNYAYAYVFTWIDANGVESVISSPMSIKPTTNKKMELTIPSIADCKGSAQTTETIRRVYRTKGIKNGTLGDAEDQATRGQAFLVNIVNNPNEVVVYDSVADKALVTTQTPPAAPPPADLPLELNYSYNKLIERLDKSVELVRLVGMDTLVHAAKGWNARVNLAVVPTYSANVESMRNEILSVLRSWTDRKRFMGDIQIADIIGILENIPSIDNVRLALADEATSDEQIIKIWKLDSSDSSGSVTDPTAEDDDTTAETDIWFTLEGMKTGLIKWDAIYNAASTDFFYDTRIIRNLFEDLPYIDGGATSAAQLDGALTYNTNTISLQNELDMATYFDPSGKTYDIYLQIDNEIMRVVNTNNGQKTAQVVRGQLGSVATTHSDLTVVDILGDVAVAIRDETVDGSGNPVDNGAHGTDKYNPFELQVTFLANGVTQTNDWGSRFVESIQGGSGGVAKVEINKKKNGCGYGIDRIAPDGRSIISTYTDDIYMKNNELPTIFDVGVVLRARNSF